MGMLYYFDNEPIAIDPCNRGRAEGKDPVVGCFEQQAVKLRLVAGKHKNPRSADCHLAGSCNGTHAQQSRRKPRRASLLRE
jgi:hypothetical protein